MVRTPCGENNFPGMKAISFCFYFYFFARSSSLPLFESLTTVQSSEGRGGWVVSSTLAASVGIERRSQLYE